MPDSDEWPDEPDEPDPEARWGAPEDDLVSVPTIDVPGEDAEDAAVAIDGDLAKYFWVTVIYANVAVAGVSIGLLLVGFRGQFVWGGGAVAVGLFALYRTYDLYRTYQEHVADDSSDGTADSDAPNAAGDGSADAAESAERNG